MKESECDNPLKCERAMTNAYLVHDGDAGLLGLGVQFRNCRRNIAGGHDVLLVANGGLDNEGVEGIRNQADYEVVLGNLLVQSFGIVDVQGDCVGSRETFDELSCVLNGPAGWLSSDVKARVPCAP